MVQPLGWYHDPLTVVMAGEDVPVRGERLFVGLQKARLYNGDQRIETREEELALAQSADRLICIVIARWRYAYRAFFTS